MPRAVKVSANDQYLAEWKDHLRAGTPAWYKGSSEYWNDQERLTLFHDQDRQNIGVIGISEDFLDIVFQGPPRQRARPELNEPDIEGSNSFLDELKKCTELTGELKYGYALDCGAGIGRVTKGVLLPRFKCVDLVEPCERLLEDAKSFVESDRVKNFWKRPCQMFEPEDLKYDLVWNQWVLQYLTDQHLVEWLVRCKNTLRPGGVLIVKENVADAHDFNEEDNSVTRTDEQYRKCFEDADMNVVFQMPQPNWPHDRTKNRYHERTLVQCSLMMYALQGERCEETDDESESESDNSDNW